MRTQIAKITKTFLGAGEDTRGIFTANLTVDYGGSGQRIGDYVFNRDDSGFTAGFIKGILDAAGVESWEQLVGRTILVLTDTDTDEWNAPVLGIAPLPTERGTQFLFADLVAAHTTRRAISDSVLTRLEEGEEYAPVETSTVAEIEQAAQQGKVVVFVARSGMAQALADELGDRAARLVPSQDQAERQCEIDGFADPEGARILVTTVHVGSIGWRAPAGSVVLFYGEGLPSATSPMIHQAKARVLPPMVLPKQGADDGGLSAA